MPSDLAITPESIWSTGQPFHATAIDSTPTLSYLLPPPYQPGDPIFTPTPDLAHYTELGNRDAQEYIVLAGDSLGAIAEKFNVRMDAIVQANNLIDPNSLEIGQRLIIPAVILQPTGPDYKIIPDSELVYGPLSLSFDLHTFIQSKGGYLAQYSQEVNGEILTGEQIVHRISQAYSINPRLLLTLIEYISGWMTNPNPEEKDNPFGYIDDWYYGLYRQLAWASIHINSGYYRWRAGTTTEWILIDGNVIPIAPTINAGTAGVQNFFAHLDDYESWLIDVSPGGVFDTYYLLFGYPFSYSIEPLIPLNLIQPQMHLPFAFGEVWSFTGGPHPSWDAGTPFGALDFAPPGEALGCVEVESWVSAVADGVVTRTGDGVVVLDLDLDGNEGTGWVVVYMHIESRDRVLVGTFLQAGDPIGHPSCEGGLSSGTHVHMARKFNGEWIPAGGNVPFNLDGWISEGTGEIYVGTLTRNGYVVESFEGNSTINQIQR